MIKKYSNYLDVLQKNQCKNPKGFTMKASCAPYKNCGNKKKK